MSEEIRTEEELNSQIKLRREKLSKLRESGNAFPNDFKPKDFALDLIEAYSAKTKEELEQASIKVALAGRIVARRLMGKASFCHLQDMTGKMQLYTRNNELANYEEFLDWDLGDIIGVEGLLFKTKTGELSVRITSARLLTKALLPLPSKFHGLTDKETCYRQRYLDLIANQKTRDTFTIRVKVVQGIREFLSKHRFLEVETPMMHVIPGGATAKPFVTHHNALNMPLYLRIAPELYLKRLVVGGLDRVFEINRNFRNEGVSTRHNPEFTMVEFYQAFADYKDLMDLTEVMLRTLTQDILGGTKVTYQGETYDFGKPFARMTVVEAILHYNADLSLEIVNDKDKLTEKAKALGIEIKNNYGLGKIQLEIFEATAEHKLKDPCFITEYPKEVSPLARENNDNPFITDRFELFIGGREIANGFSELNDPDDQANRFKKQVEALESGDDEAMHYDSDYITALEYGLAPTAGEGIGIDRLVMLFSDAPSIRDVILFPHMRANS